MPELDFQTLVGSDGRVTAVVVPIEAWREIASEIETHHLVKSPAMRERLIAALGREGGLPLDDALDRLGVLPDELGGNDA